MLKKIFLPVLIVVIFLFSVSTTFAQKTHLTQIESESIMPSDGYKYSFKRLKEKVILGALSIAKNKKADYYQILLTKRLAELYTVSDKKDTGHIEKTSLRYMTTAGKLSEYIIKKKILTKKDSTIEIFKQHIAVLEIAEKNFDPLSAEWRFVHDDINYLLTYIDNLNKLSVE